MPRKPTSEMNKESDDRTRTWTFILYPESAPEDWLDRLNDMHIQFIVSPLHDKDKEPGTGDKEFKKAHYHIVLKFQTKKSYDQICEITNSLNQPRPERVRDFQTMVRYLCHLDHPHKYQYPTSELQAFGGLDVEEYLKPLATLRRIYITQMIDYIEENNITELRDLTWYARRYRFDDWYKLITDNCSYFMNMYLKSRKNSIKRNVVYVNSDGEYLGDV